MLEQVLTVREAGLKGRPLNKGRDNMNITQEDVETEFFTDRAKRGASFLDEEKPGWFESIDLNKLNMGDGSDCVIGQLFKDADRDYDDSSYFIGVEELHIGETGRLNEYTLGFMLKVTVGSSRNWELLTDAWKIQISNRINAQESK